MKISRLHAEKVQRNNTDYRKIKKENILGESRYMFKKKKSSSSCTIKNSSLSKDNNESYKLAQKLLYDTYNTEQEIYLQSKIDEIKKSVSNKKSAMAWKAVNDVSERKKSNKAKIKAISGEKRIIVWHNHFKDLLGNPSEITVSAI